MGDLGGFVDNTLGTNIFGSNSNDRAVGIQNQSTQQANQALTNSYNDQRGYLDPYNQAGMRALSGMGNPDFQRSFSMADYQKDPGYQFRLDEGNKAINAAAAARGMGNSGATMKALTQYGQDYASGEYQKAYDRFNNDKNTQFNRFSTLAGIGQNASNNLAGAAGTYGSNISNNITGLGNAQASAQIGKGNQQTGFIGQLYQNLGTGVGMAGGKGGGGAGALFSDERLKTNIEPVSKEDLDEMKKHLKAYAFNYVSDDFGKGDWIGIMAQDLEKSKLGKTLVVENEKGQKMIDTKKVMSLFLATMAEAA
ncbi:MAG: tail fiber domain-containing protein [Bdellovibrio sp.]